MFITFEGPDGAGKTTQINFLDKALASEGYKVVLTREPGGNRISERIREILHDPANTEMSPRAEVLLYSAARAQHVDQVILPALASGAVVLCDRYADSTLAYQGYGRNLDLDALRSLTNFATAELRPDLTVYIEISPEEGLRRRRVDASAEWNRLDREALAFHQRVHAGYLELAALEPNRWLIIDGERPPKTISEEIVRLVFSRLRKGD